MWEGGTCTSNPALTTHFIYNRLSFQLSSLKSRVILHSYYLPC